jgi:hypothetical protein
MSKVRLVGGDGGDVHPLEPTTTMISFEGGLVPSPFRACTRRK